MAMEPCPCFFLFFLGLFFFFGYVDDLIKISSERGEGD